MLRHLTLLFVLLLPVSLILAAPGTPTVTPSAVSSEPVTAAPAQNTSALYDVVAGIRTTAYTHSESDHVAYGRDTAAGGKLRYGKVRSAAADWSVFPVGTQFHIAGDPALYEVDDYGSALVGTSTIDLYKPNRASMNAWGTRRVDITVIKWGSFSRSLAIIEGRITKQSHVRAMANRIKQFHQLLASTVASR